MFHWLNALKMSALNSMPVVAYREEAGQREIGVDNRDRRGRCCVTRPRRLATAGAALRELRPRRVTGIADRIRRAAHGAGRSRSGASPG